MSEFGGTSLLMLAASIGASDPWVMAPWSGAVTLTPLRMMSADERDAATDQAVLLCLNDLGHLVNAEDANGHAAASPLRSQSEVVLLLSWSLLPTVAELDLVARTSSRELPSQYAPEDWLTAWHHFVEDDSWRPSAPVDEIAGRENTLRGLPFAGSRHYVLGSLASESSALEFGFTPSTQRSLVHAASHEHVTTRERDAGPVEPLVFTNPGSAPEGLSPLFVNHQGRHS